MLEIRYHFSSKGDSMKRYYNETIDEEYFVEELANGLKVFLYPKKDFYKNYAIFSTKYGSQDLEFIPIHEKEFLKTPEGIAHFLEHKLFENEDGTDASNLFAKTGADVNAFTTANQTAYLFSGTDSLYENVELLINFVQEPCFKKESIDRERGIIEQELLMYLDQPTSVQYFGALRGMYKKNAVRNEIGGSPESIQEINEDLLYTCYNTFYHPSNMQIAIVGNFDVDKMVAMIQENQAKKQFAAPSLIQRRYYLEDQTVNQKSSFVEMDVNIPKVSVGIKLPHEDCSPLKTLKKNIALEIITDIYFDEASDNYEKLMDEEIINNSFSYDIYCEDTYGHLLFNLDTDQPEVFIEKITEVIQKIKNEKIDDETFYIYKRLYQARNIKRFNSLEYIANLMIEFEQSNMNLFDLVEVTNQLTKEDVEAVRTYFDESAIASFTIYPKKEKEV